MVTLFDLSDTIYNSDMFHPDNIKNKQPGTQLSIALFNYWHKWGGPKGLTQRLNTNAKVSREIEIRKLSNKIMNDF